MKKLFSLLLFLACTVFGFAQNTGINTTTPQAYLDINGDLALRMGTINLPNAANADVNTTTNRKSVYRITNSTPLGASISGLTGGVDGRTITLINTTTSPLGMVSDGAGNPSAAANRIITIDGNTLFIQANGAATLLYDGTASRWRVISFSKPDAVAAINVWNQNGNDIYNVNNANVGIGTSSPKAKLDVAGTVKITDGTQAAGKVLTSDSNGLAKWQTVNLTNAWGVNGNANTTAINYVGTTDAQPLRFGVNGGSAGIIDSANANTALGLGTLRKLTNVGYTGASVAIGQYALQNAQISSGTVAIGFESMKNFIGQNFPAGTLGANHNTAIGFQTLYANDGISNTAIGGSALRNNTSGIGNTALGDLSLYNNKTGNANTALGNQALFSDTAGSSNIAIGSYALKNNLSGNGNIAIGNAALFNNIIDSKLVAIGDSALFYANDVFGFAGQSTENTAIGSKALFKNTLGAENTSLGFEALRDNTLGWHNSAIGNRALQKNVDGNENTAIGSYTLYNNLSGTFNTATGYEALIANTQGNNNTANGAYALFYNKGSQNTAVGTNSMSDNGTGNSNTALGYNSLPSNTTGSRNIAIGADALQANTIVSNLVAIGDSALALNGLGDSNGFATGNTAIGSKTLLNNTNGYSNTAIGFESLKKNSSGNSNTGIGFYALQNNSGGTANTALGFNSLRNNTVGQSNIAIGISAMYKNTEGGGNIANGYFALHNNNSDGNIGIGTQTLNNNIYGYQNVAVGEMSLFTSSGGNRNTAIGAYTSVTTPGLSNATAIGALAQVGCSNCMVLGAANGINDATSGTKVAIGTTTPLVDLHIKQSNETYPVNGGGMRFERQTNTDHWDIGTDNGSDFDFVLNGSAKAYINHSSGAYTVASDFRLKKDIQIVGTVLPSIMELQPKTYHYKDNKNSDPLSYGFIAQEVEKLFPDFVTTKGADGMKAIAYQNLNVIAIKAIQEQQTLIEALLKRLKKLEAK